MKKLLVLLLIAALVGIIVSRNRGAERSASNTSAPSAAEAPSPAPAPPAVPGHGPDQGRLEPARRTLASAGPRETNVELPALAAKQTAPPAPAQAAPKEGIQQTAQTPPDSPTAQQEKLLEQAHALLEAGDRVKAREILTGLYLNYRGRQAQDLRAVLDAINKDLIFNPRCMEGAIIHKVSPGETLTKIGAQYHVNWRMVALLNGMEPDDLLRAGRQLKVLAGAPSIVVWKGEFRLALLFDGAYVKEYPIGIGKDDSTPSGQFKVDEMMIRAPWNPPGGGTIKYGEEGYALGERWIAFDDQPGAAGLGIHGTDHESSIGTKCSRGCIRMSNKDVIELYAFLKPGAKVRILE
ncbi:MAG: L,D-transpeptidase family protein [Planctomycetes bacterium]|nr:L,D-transpeptidase family protein [Planctomycetota bacterium]